MEGWSIFWDLFSPPFFPAWTFLFIIFISLSIQKGSKLNSQEVF